jgi:phage terminase large subunit-like protein
MTSTLSCAPRYGTPRRPERPTIGGAVGVVARRLGKPLMPWQQHVADVLGEYEIVDGRRVFFYSEYGLTVPRQSGKSTFVMAKAVHRSSTKFFGPRQRVVYTAQTRKKAREKWEDDYAAVLEAHQGLRVALAPRQRQRAHQIPERLTVRHRVEHREGRPRRHRRRGVHRRGVRAGRRLEQAFGPP